MLNAISCNLLLSVEDLTVHGDEALLQQEEEWILGGKK